MPFRRLIQIFAGATFAHHAEKIWEYFDRCRSNGLVLAIQPCRDSAAAFD